MSTFIVVRLGQFYASALRKIREGLSEKPIIVTRDNRVLDAEEEAKKKGISPGMPIKLAKALSEGMQLIPYKLEDYIQAKEDWLDLALMYTNSLECAAEHEAIFTLDHPQPEDLAQKCARTLRKAGYEVAWGAAKSRWVAELSCKFGTGWIEDGYAYIGRFGVDQLPVESAISERLLLLGYRTIEQLRKAPLEVLADQFGTQGLVVYQCARAKYHGTLAPNYPLDSVSAVCGFDGLLLNRQALDYGLMALADELGEKLLETDRSSTCLKLQWELEEDLPMSVQRTFTKAICDRKSAYAALRLLVGTPPEGVVRLHASLLGLVSAQGKQRDLALYKPTGKDLEQASSTLQNTLGSQSVMLGSQMNVPRRTRLLSAWKHATGWR